MHWDGKENGNFPIRGHRWRKRSVEKPGTMKTDFIPIHWPSLGEFAKFEALDYKGFRPVVTEGVGGANAGGKGMQVGHDVANLRLMWQLQRYLHSVITSLVRNMVFPKNI